MMSWRSIVGNIVGKQHAIHNLYVSSNAATHVIYVIQSVQIQLIGSHSNCSSNSIFIIYHTFNIVTEWLHTKVVLPYYKENEHLLHLPSKASIPDFSVIKTNLSGVFSDYNVPPISVKQLDTIIGDLR